MGGGGARAETERGMKLHSWARSEWSRGGQVCRSFPGEERVVWREGWSLERGQLVSEERPVEAGPWGWAAWSGRWSAGLVWSGRDSGPRGLGPLPAGRFLRINLGGNCFCRGAGSGGVWSAAGGKQSASRILNSLGWGAGRWCESAEWKLSSPRREKNHFSAALANIGGPAGQLVSLEVNKPGSLLQREDAERTSGRGKCPVLT